MHTVGIIGSGEWSQKIATSLRNEFLVEEYSSRAIKNLSQSVDDSNRVIWIASRNSEQLDLVALILKSGFNGKIILEKPYFTNLDERKHLLKLIESNQNRIYLSRVWVKSRIWREFTEAVLSRGHKFQISAIRVGDKRRSEFRPPLDWIPHDLYLASDLSSILNQEIRVVESRWESDNDIVIGTLMVGTGCTINITAGYSSQRKNSWKVINESGDCIELDFASHSIKINEGLIFQEANQETCDVPILNFVNWVLDQSYDFGQQKLIDLNSQFLLGANQI